MYNKHAFFSNYYNSSNKHGLIKEQFSPSGDRFTKINPRKENVSLNKIRCLIK